VGELRNQRVLVVGASSGLGRVVGARLAAQGATVAFAARRRELVEAAAAEVGGAAIGVACDVRDSDSCDAAVAAVVDAFGGLDALVYCAGVGALRPLTEADADTWDHVLGTNVVGASLVTRACLPHLEASTGRALYFSSVSASLTPPWPGLGTYIVSKAALDKLVEAYAVEHPTVAFTRITMGDSGGGEGPEASQFSSSWDQEYFNEMLGVWFARGYVSGTVVDADELGRVVAAVLCTDATLSTVVVRPAPLPVPPSEPLKPDSLSG
jgi:NAD(P)-dependent dehydrogenase (short-subunit alcohol dehydrogenase family)